MWLMTHDTWHLTHDTWHMTYDTWHMTHHTSHITHHTWHMTPIFVWKNYLCSYPRTSRNSVSPVCQLLIRKPIKTRIDTEQTHGPPRSFRYLSFSTTLAEHDAHRLQQCPAFGWARTCLFLSVQWNMSEWVSNLPTGWPNDHCPTYVGAMVKSLTSNLL